jgi:predicted YcjX-like family ATPase
MQMIDAEAADVTKQKQAALRLVLDAFAEADLDGIDSDCMAQAALFAALKEFVMVYGEEPVAKFTERLPERVRNGEFTVQRHG